MPALSMATSVPVPIAMPTSAAASAGASLIPSPAIATIASLLAQVAARSVLLSRFDASFDLVDARAVRRRLRRAALSPVSMTI